MRCLSAICRALLIPLCAAGASAAEQPPSVAMIAMTFDAPTVGLGGLAHGHIRLSDGQGAAAGLDQDLTVLVTCDFDGLVSVTQPQLIPAGATSADFQILVLDLDLFGDPLITVTADLGIYGADHGTIRVAGLLN